MPGTLFVVATPIGNLEDITARALRTLREVALIAAEDTRRTRNLLTHFGIATPTTSLHEHNEHAKFPGLIDRLLAGESIALVSDAGTPVISDPGSRLIAAAIAAGLKVEPIPGVSAMTTLIMVSGLTTGAFTWAGFPPVRAKELEAWISSYATGAGVVVFFEAPHRLVATLGRLLAIAGDVQVCIGREMTKVHEEFLRGRLSELLPRLDAPRGEFTIAVDFGSVSRPGAEVPSATAAELAAELGRVTETQRLHGRAAVAAVARKFGLSTNAVYARLKGPDSSGE